MEDKMPLVEVIEEYKPTILIGLSAQVRLPRPFPNAH
jgi:hypothetical protein